MKLVIEPRGLSLLTKVGNFLTGQGVKSYLVGGFVRDMLLGRNTADIDIVVGADALELAPKIAAAVNGKYVTLDKVNRVGRVIIVGEDVTSTKGQWEFDFSTLKGDIEQDLAQRDFTIDAMAVDLVKITAQPSQLPASPKEAAERKLRKKGGIPRVPPMIIDPFGGWNDLNGGIVRAVSRGVFESDAARLLRAVRLAAELGFNIDKETATLIRSQCHLVVGVAGERLREELLRLLAVPHTEQLLPHLDELGLVTAIMPELKQMKGVKQPKEHFWDVFEHSLKTVGAVDYLLRQGTWEYAGQEVLAVTPWSAMLAQHFEQEVSHGSTRRSLLKLAALLHDNAKPQTKAVDESGRIRFLGHGKEGAVIAASILERLRFSTKEIRLVETVIRHHLRPGQMSREGLPSHRAIYRYFRDTGDAGIDILFLSLADHLATRGTLLNPAGWQEHTHLVEYVLAQRFQEENLVVPPKLIDGHDLINIFGMSPGPKIGKLLETIREAQAAGELTTRDEALAYIRQRLLTKVV